MWVEKRMMKPRLRRPEKSDCDWPSCERREGCARTCIGLLAGNRNGSRGALRFERESRRERRRLEARSGGAAEGGAAAAAEVSTGDAARELVGVGSSASPAGCAPAPRRQSIHWRASAEEEQERRRSAPAPGPWCDSSVWLR